MRQIRITFEHDRYGQADGYRHPKVNGETPEADGHRASGYALFFHGPHYPSFRTSDGMLCLAEDQAARMWSCCRAGKRGLALRLGDFARGHVAATSARAICAGRKPRPRQIEPLVRLRPGSGACPRPVE